MKAVILERRGEYAALLCEDGTFERRRVSGAVGETVELSGSVAVFPARKRWTRSLVAAALALVVTGSALGYMGGTASAYVSLDVEDSAIELTVNHFGRVIAVSAVSEESEELAERLSAEVRHQPVAKALNRTMGRLRDEGYLDDERDTVIAGVTSDNTKRAAKLTQTVECAAAGHTLYVTESSRTEREQAKGQRMSAGRFGFARDHGELPEPKPQDARHGGKPTEGQPTPEGQRDRPGDAPPAPRQRETASPVVAPL